MQKNEHSASTADGSRVQWFVLLAFACSLFASGAILFGGSSTSYGDDLPKLKDALKDVVHGKFKLRRDQIEIRYDFREQSQVEDFWTDSRFDITSDGTTVSFGDKKRPKLNPGQLVLPQRNNLAAQLPLQGIKSVCFWVKDVAGFSIKLRGDGQRVEANFSDFASISFGSDNQFQNSKRPINLSPKKVHKIELLLSRTKAIGKVNGSKVLERKVPKDFGSVNSLSFGQPLFSRQKASSQAVVTGLLIKGTVADDAGLLAANRGRSKEKLPPVWLETHTVKGKHFTVLSGVSEEVAQLWSDELEAVVAAILTELPPNIAPPPPPEPEEGDEEEESSPKPIDKKPPASFEYHRTVYVFGNPRVLEAYAGQPQAPRRFPDGSWGVLHREQEGVARSTRLFRWSVAREVLDGLYLKIPYWWERSHAIHYYWSTIVDGTLLPDYPAETAATVRKYLEAGTEPRVSDLLAGWTYKKGSTNPDSLGWAWLHFLRTADGGAYAPYLKRYHQALRHGASAEEAGETVFPTAVFNELYPKFETFLESL